MPVRIDGDVVVERSGATGGSIATTVTVRSGGPKASLGITSSYGDTGGASVASCSLRIAGRRRGTEMYGTTTTYWGDGGGVGDENFSFFDGYGGVVGPEVDQVVRKVQVIEIFLVSSRTGDVEVKRRVCGSPVVIHSSCYFRNIDDFHFDGEVLQISCARVI